MNIRSTWQSNVHHARIAWTRLTSRTSIAWFILCEMGLIVLYFVIDVYARRVSHLPISAYEQPIIAVQFLDQLFRQAGWIIAPVLVVIIWRRRRLFEKWSSLRSGSAIRIVILASAFVGAWTYSTYAINLYFDQDHWVDRVLLVVLFVGLFWRPILALPFCVLQLAIMWQFDYPIVGLFSWTETHVPIRMLELFAAFWFLRAFSQNLRAQHFIFAAICLIASQYFASGLGKLQLNWLAVPNLHFGLLGGYSVGWMGTLPSEHVVLMTQIFAMLRLPFMLFTLFVELGAILILSKRKATWVWLCLFITFHTGIFLIIGIAFWKWATVEVAMLFALNRNERSPIRGLYSTPHFLLSIFLITAGVFVFKPTNLSWYDTRVFYTYKMVGIGESGHEFDFSPRDFAPYRDIFTMGNFGFLAHESALTGPYGITYDKRLATTLSSPISTEALAQLESSHRRDVFVNENAKRFDRFVSRFFRRWREHGKRPSWFNSFSGPGHLLSWGKASDYIGQEKIKTVRVIRVLAYYDDAELRTLRSDLVHVLLLDLVDSK